MTSNLEESTMGKDGPTHRAEETKPLRTMEAELSFSRWNSSHDVELTHRKSPGGFQLSDGLDRDLDFPSGDPNEIQSPRLFGGELRRRGGESLGEWIDRTQPADLNGERGSEADENRHTHGDPMKQKSQFRDLGGNGNVVDEIFDRAFGYTADTQVEAESLLDAERSDGIPLDWHGRGEGQSAAAHEMNGYSGRQRYKQVDEEMLRASAEEPSSLRKILKSLIYIILWYTFSTSLTLYNKLLLGADLGQFPAPLLMNTIHFSMQAAISTLMLRCCCQYLRPPVRMSWKDYFLRVFPTAVATALDIDLTNASFVFISVTFATMCKSSTPVFLLLFAFLFKLESPSLKLVGIIAILSVGVLFAVAKETHFHLLGFILVMLSAVMAGFRWTVMQVLLQKEEYGLNNPFAAMSYLTPIMAVATCICSLVSEPWHKLSQTRYFDTRHHIFESTLLMLLGGSLAFFMVLTEYLLISETSALTMTVAGIVKEVVTIVVAIFFFHDTFTPLKALGLFIIIFGVSLFNWYKYQKIVEGKLSGNHGLGQSEADQRFAKYSILTDKNSAEVGLSEPGA